MIKVSNYLDMTHEKFKGKSELELWMMLEEDLQKWVVVNEAARMLEVFLTDFSNKVGKAAMMVKSSVPKFKNLINCSICKKIVDPIITPIEYRSVESKGKCISCLNVPPASKES